jgi:hypothetical protein
MGDNLLIGHSVEFGFFHVLVMLNGYWNTMPQLSISFYRFMARRASQARAAHGGTRNGSSPQVHDLPGYSGRRVHRPVLSITATAR